MPNHNGSGFSAYFINVHRDAELGEHGHWNTFLDNSYSAEGIRFEIRLVHYRCFLYGFSFLIDESSTNDLEKWKHLKGQPSFASCSFVCLKKDKPTAIWERCWGWAERESSGEGSGRLSLTSLLPSPSAALAAAQGLWQHSSEPRRESSSPAAVQRFAPPLYTEPWSTTSSLSS